MFQRYLAIILKTSVRFTLKELTCEFSSFFDIISGSDEGGMLGIAVMFGMTKKKENDSKRKHCVPNFFTNKKKNKHSAL